MQRRIPRSITVTAVLVVMLGIVPVSPALAVDVQTSATSRVLGDVTHQSMRIDLGSGATARGDILWFREDDPNVELRPRLARGTVAGLQQMLPLARNRLQQGAIAGVNASYWLPRPSGAPNGLHVANGRLISGQAVTNFGQGGRPTGRGMIGIQAGGRMVMDEILVDLHLDQPDLPVEPARFDEINRQVWPPSARLNGGGVARPDGELLLYDDRFGASVLVPAGGRVAVVEGLRVGSSGRTTGQVIDVRFAATDLDLAVPSGTHVIVAYGDREQQIVNLSVGREVGVTTTITPQRTPAEGWQDLAGGAAGGQLMIQGGARRPGAEWTAYSSFSWSHATSRQPRTAIGRTADGRGMLVTVDGRRLGWSSGVTVSELANVMLALGAVDAVNLDGGGSTTMTVDARIRNRPSETGRSVADGLFLHAPLPPPSRPLNQACPEGSVPGSGFGDVPGTTHAAAIDCLAWWQVTRGVSETRFAPADGVTREQMASFVVSWIDGASARGDAVALPQTDRRTFDDVTDGNVHAEAIARLSEVGIIRGRTASTFEPRVRMSRAQTASLLSAAIAYLTDTPLPDGRDMFMDDNGSVHEDNIDRLTTAGVVGGVGGFEFRPDDPVTRGAMASLIMRSSDLVVELGATTPPG